MFSIKLKKTSVFLLFLLFWISILPLSAQRPKIGLALAGGGAKGLAHIGILKAIDSAGLKVDYITGTSMGAIVGSLYAAGYSGKQIEDITLSIDWGQLFKNSANYKDIALSEKDEYNGYILEVPLIGYKPALSSGLINPEGIWAEFLKHLYPVYDVKDFHKLNIPFECIATDLETGKPVVLSSGEIVQAIRSSMAIPSVFTPVEYQGKYLVDGGLVRNFPVRYAKEMGADYLIGVSLWDGLLKRDRITNALDVFNQITSYVDAADAEEEKAMCNLLISPPIGDYTAASFSDYRDIIRIGNEMGKQMYPTFKHLADSLNAIEPIPYDPYSRLKGKASVTIDSIEVAGLSGIKKKQLIHNMDLDINRAYSARKLSESLKRAYSTLNYKYLYYELYPTDKLNHAKIRLITEEDYHSWVKLGLFYNNFLGAGISLNYTLRNFRKTNSRSMVKLAIGDNFDGIVQTKFFYGDNSKHQLKGELRVTDLKIPIYEGSNRLFVYNATFSTLEASYMKYVNKYTGIGTGLSYNLKTYSPDIAATIRVKGHESQLYFFVNQLTNSIDRRFFTTRGAISNFEGGIAFARNTFNKATGLGVDTLSKLLSSKPYFKLRYLLTGYIPVSPKTSLVGSFNVGALINHKGVYLNEFFFGGEQPLFKQQTQFVGLKDAQIITDSYVAGLFGIQTNLLSNLYTQARINYGYYNFINGNSSISNANRKKQILGLGVTAGYYVSKWPVQLSVSYSPQIGKVYTAFSIGYAFY